MRHLGVVAVRPVQRVGLAFAHVHGEWFAVVRLVGVVRTAMVSHELGQERVGAGGVPGWVGQAQDVVVLSDREFGALPQIRELLLQAVEEVRAPCVFRLERHAEALHRLRRDRTFVEQSSAAGLAGDWFGPEELLLRAVFSLSHPHRLRRVVP